MPEVETRDIAVQARSDINSHIQDCVRFRQQLSDNHKEMREDLKKINNRVMLILGGLMLLSKGLDFLVPFLHKVTP